MVDEDYKIGVVLIFNISLSGMKLKISFLSASERRPTTNNFI